jgi:hypothetical protein
LLPQLRQRRTVALAHRRITAGEVTASAAYLAHAEGLAGRCLAVA